MSKKSDQSFKEILAFIKRLAKWEAASRKSNPKNIR